MRTPPTGPTREIFVPGRLCLFGEHSDWCGELRAVDKTLEPGHTIIVPTEQGLHAECWGTDRPELHLSSARDDGRHEEVRLPFSDVPGLERLAASSGFFSYAAGMVLEALDRGWVKAPPVDRAEGGGTEGGTEGGGGAEGGAEGSGGAKGAEGNGGEGPRSSSACASGVRVLNHTTSLPMGKGLSSSAALCVLLARAFSIVLGLELTREEEMDAAFLGERRTPSKCGRMDQAVALGRPALLTHDGGGIRVEELPVARPLRLVLVDLGARKDTIAILSRLRAGIVGNRDSRLARLLGRDNAERVQRVVACLADGDLAAVGREMVAAQRDFDLVAGPHCPSQLGVTGSPKLHALLRALETTAFAGMVVGKVGDASEAAGEAAGGARVLEETPPGPAACWPTRLRGCVLGAKGVGSQGDGSAQILCVDEAAQLRVAETLRRELGLRCLPLTVMAHAPGP